MTITANTFVDAAAHVCAAAAELGVDTAIALHRVSGPVAIVIDNDRSATDDVRRWMVSEDAWRTNPMMVELRRQLALLGPEVFDVPAHTDLVRGKGYMYTGQTKHIGIPMIGPDGWFGSVAYSLDVAPTSPSNVSSPSSRPSSPCGAARAASRRCPRSAHSPGASTR